MIVNNSEENLENKSENALLEICSHVYTFFLPKLSQSNPDLVSKVKNRNMSTIF